MTRLKALELFGFKSFADRTRFEFPEGITVVVGPNGSGKSNVVDAIKWVLGEQSVRSLRGKEMSDVIFAGSGSRKPLNYAEVSLIFDNSAGELPVEAAEVAVMRRVTRDGDSEYLVNGETSRLRDIRELFSGTGAATQAYSVIEQGRVDALLVATGRDRRAVFEEAAGITRFRARRTEALRRLERAELNRQRLADIVGEVSTRLETVRHQAARARRWRTMTDRLRALRLAVSRADLAAIDAAVANIDGALATARGELGTADSAAAAATQTLADVATLAGDITPRIAAARGAAATDTQRAAAAEATLSALRDRRAEVEREVTRAESACAAATRVERSAVAALDAALATVADRTAAVADVNVRLAACERSAQGSHGDATERRARAAAAAALLDERRRDRLQLESTVERAASRSHDARHAADAARQALDAARMQAARLAEAHAAWEGNIGSLDIRLVAATREVETLEAEEQRTTESLQGAWHDAAGWRAKLEACRERCDVLREIVERQEGLSDASRRLLAGNAAAVPGLAGVVADLVVASVDWAPLVDVALGATGQSLVVEALDEAVRWHAAWADTPAGRDVLAAGGRIGFIAADALRELPAFDPARHPGVVGRLDRLVAADAPQPIDTAAGMLLERLLGRAWVVDRVEHALPLLPTSPPGTLFLARSGQTLTAEGRFEIGAPAATAGLVARRAELRALDSRRAQLTSTVAEATRAIESLQGELQRLREAIHQARARRQEAAETIASSRGELDRVTRERRAADAAIGAAERDLREADARAADAAGELHAARDAYAASEPALAAARDEVARAEAAIADLERSRGELAEEIHRLRVEQATCGEKLTRAHDAVAAAEAALAMARADAAGGEARRHEADGGLAAYELDLLAAGAAHAEAVTALERSTRELATLEAEADVLDARRRRTATALEDARTASFRLAERVHQHELEAGEARHRRARIVERIRDEYDIDIEVVEAAADPELPADAPPLPTDRAEADREIEELRRKLASMVTVNLEALAESEELAARLAGLEAQLTDITTAKESISELISRIDEESRRLLGETIETVRGHFRELFERLFGGGQADLVLEPDVDLLETAVEIVARPPGKEPRNISLLSGGEKTMTCVALLLAIFRSRPSPFCVLDEVDAALDEANVDRYVGVLRDFLGSTQFIVVTHSKKTMAAGTTLYGVTMEESGVSKRVSVRFESTAAGSLPRGAKAA